MKSRKAYGLNGTSRVYTETGYEEPGHLLWWHRPRIPIPRTALAPLASMAGELEDGSIKHMRRFVLYYASFSGQPPVKIAPGESDQRAGPQQTHLQEQASSELLPPAVYSIRL